MPISVAPMIDCTDRHFRYLLRLITRHTLLYTEMLTVKDLLGKKCPDLDLDIGAGATALQLGGSQPDLLAQCSRLAQQAGFTEINLNVGCPSPRVAQGAMGACLMNTPKVVAQCVAAMQATTHLPITIKCRTGVDNHDSYENLYEFIAQVSAAGCQKFIIHARKAWLKGLNPKQNREIPPLQYERVYQLKQDFPQLTIVINGGIVTLEQAMTHLDYVDGVMIGRAVYADPFLLAEVDQLLFSSSLETLPKITVVKKYLDYMEAELHKGTKITIMSKHLIGLFQGQPGAKLWRQHISCHIQQKGLNAIYEALQMIAG